MFVDGELKLNEGGRSGGGGVKSKGRQQSGATRWCCNSGLYGG
jgi:hypothetical protein